MKWETEQWIAFAAVTLVFFGAIVYATDPLPEVDREKFKRKEKTPPGR